MGWMEHAIVLIPVYSKRQSFIWSFSIKVFLTAGQLGVATDFWNDSFGLLKKSKQFNQGNIASDSPALMLMLSVTALMVHSH